MNVPAAATTSLRPRRHSPDSSNNNSNNSEQLIVGSYNPDESGLGTSPPFSGIGDGDGDGDAEIEFSEDSVNWIRRTNSGKFPLSVPDGGFVSAAAVKEKESKNPQGKSKKGNCGFCLLLLALFRM